MVCTMAAFPGNSNRWVILLPTGGGLWNSPVPVFSKERIQRREPRERWSSRRLSFSKAKGTLQRQRRRAPGRGPLAEFYLVSCTGGICFPPSRLSKAHYLVDVSPPTFSLCEVCVVILSMSIKEGWGHKPQCKWFNNGAMMASGSSVKRSSLSAKIGMSQWPVSLAYQFVLHGKGGALGEPGRSEGGDWAACHLPLPLLVAI